MRLAFNEYLENYLHCHYHKEESKRVLEVISQNIKYIRKYYLDNLFRKYKQYYKDCTHEEKKVLLYIAEGFIRYAFQERKNFEDFETKIENFFHCWRLVTDLSHVEEVYSTSEHSRLSQSLKFNELYVKEMFNRILVNSNRNRCAFASKKFINRVVENATCSAFDLKHLNIKTNEVIND